MDHDYKNFVKWKDSKTGKTYLSKKDSEVLNLGDKNKNSISYNKKTNISDNNLNLTDICNENENDNDLSDIFNASLIDEIINNEEIINSATKTNNIDYTTKKLTLVNNEISSSSTSRHYISNLNNNNISIVSYSDFVNNNQLNRTANISCDNRRSSVQISN